MSSELLPQLLERARSFGATAADALMVQSVALSTSVRMGKPEQLERAESKGVALRVFVGQRIASVSCSDLAPASLAKLAEQAVAMAKASTEDPFSALAPGALLCKNPMALDLDDDNEPSAEWLEEQCKTAEEAGLAVKGITNSEGADAGYSRSRMALATSGGFFQAYAASSFSISMSALAGAGTQMERDYDFTSARHRSDLASAQAVGRKAGERAVARLGARKAQTQAVPVVYDPRVSRSLLSAVAGAINGSSVARGTSFLKDAMGKTLFPSHITIIDEPHRMRGLASRPFDSEGVATKRLALVESGMLKSWLLDTRAAKQLGLQTTGHASRGGSPSSSNLYMAPGSHSPAELMKDISSGFYVTETFGAGANLITGDYSVGAAGFWIENGKIAYPVSEVTIAGRLHDMFAHLTPASDLEFRYGTNAPTLRVEGLTVAGK